MPNQKKSLTSCKDKRSIILLCIQNQYVIIFQKNHRGNCSGDDYAIINILRPSSYGGAIKFGIWDRDTFVGVSTPKTIIQYKAAPGEHLIMARAENWSAIKANVDAGKNYYILAAPRPGALKARVALSVISPNEPKLKSWMRGRVLEIDQTKLGTYVDERVDHASTAAGNYDDGTATVSGTMLPSDGR